MARVLGVLAASLWVVGIVLLVITIRDTAPAGIFSGFPDTPLSKLVIGTSCVAVAGFLAVLRDGRRG